MANYTPSALVKGQTLLTKKFMSGEFRPEDTAALSIANVSSKANPTLKELRGREDRAVSVYMPIRQAKGTASDRIYNHTGTKGDSIEVPVVWQTFAETFSISIKQGDNNILSFDEQYAASFQDRLLSILSRMDDWALAQMVANITEINKSTLGAWSAVTNRMTVPVGQTNFYFQNMISSMKSNRWKAPFAIIGDQHCALLASQLLTQGESNSTNLGWQMGNSVFTETTKEVFAGVTHGAIAFPAALFGLTPWIPPLNRKAIDPDLAWNGNNGDFGHIMYPVVNDKGAVMYQLPIALSMYTKRSDEHEANGSKQDVKLEVEMSLDLAMLNAPLSSLRASGDFASKTDTVLYGFDLESGTVNA